MATTGFQLQVKDASDGISHKDPTTDGKTSAPWSSNKITSGLDLPNIEKAEPQPSYSLYDAGGESPVYDSTHRTLKPRHIQLIGIGGTIGTVLFVQIGRGLLNGGPASLFIAFTFW